MSCKQSAKNSVLQGSVHSGSTPLLFTVYNIIVLGEIVKPSSTVNNLGVVSDSDMSLSHCQLFADHLDYCNSLYSSLTENELSRLSKRVTSTSYIIQIKQVVKT